jgi:tetratricopeptide (TPR) repeat protein
MSYDRCGDWSDDYTLFRTDLRKAPQSAVIRQQAALAAVEKGQYAEVITLLAESGMLDESAVNCRCLGLAYCRSGAMDEGIELLKRAVSLKPDWAQPYEDLGLLALSRGDKKSGIEYLKEAVNRDESNDSRWANLALAYRDNGNIEEFIAALKKTLELNPDNLQALRASAALNWQRGNYQRCTDIFRHILLLYPHDEDASYWLKRSLDAM